jgi:hypothetical protein
MVTAMGLDTTHGAWHGSYSAFLRWRHTLAEAAGYRIREATPEERDAGVYSSIVDIHWEAFEAKNYQGEWDTVPGDDPLLYLLVHSDCDGVIHPEQGVHIARRLEQLLPLLDDTEVIGHIRPHMRGKTQQFIDGLQAAVKAREDVEFF